jgi:hypothetical protein
MQPIKHAQHHQPQNSIVAGAFSLTGGSNKNRNFSIFALIQFDELNPCDIAQIPSETSIPAESIDGEAR